MDEIQKINTPCDLGLSKTFSYNGNKVRMKKENGIVFVCLTDMAKGFPDKNLSVIMNSKEMTDYITRIAEIRIFSSADFQPVTTIKGGNPTEQGTWAYRKIALRVAQKLSTDFAIWVDDRIEELLTQGVATVNDDDATILRAMQVLQKRVEEKQRALQTAQTTMAIQSEQLKGQQPKVDYYDKVLNSTSTMTTGQVAACFGMSAIALNKRLCAIGMQYKQSGMYFLKHPYSSYHLSDVRTYPYNKADGSVGTKQYLVWNERGKQFLVMLHQNDFDIKRTKQAISPDFWMMLLRPQCTSKKNK